MDELEYWPSRECVESIPELASGFCRFLRSNVRLSSEPAEVPFKNRSIETAVAWELDRLSYPFYNRSVAEFSNDCDEAARRGWYWQVTKWILATPRTDESDFWGRQETRYPVYVARGPHFTHSETYNWGNEISGYLDSLFESISTLRIYFNNGPVFSRGHWIAEGEWLWSELSAMESCLRGCEPPKEPWFQYQWCRAPIHGLRMPERYLSLNAKDRPVPRPLEIDRHGTKEHPNADNGFPVEWLDRIESLASSLEAALQANPRPEGKTTATTPKAKLDPKTDDETDAADKTCPLSAAEIEALMVSHLHTHHEINKPGRENWNPVTVRGTVKVTGVSLGSVSKWFGDHFVDHRQYRQACRRNPDSVAAKLRSLHGDNTLSREHFTNVSLDDAEGINSRPDSDGPLGYASYGGDGEN